MALAVKISEDTIDEFAERASEACAFMKALSHESRLMILCHLISGEKTVTELEALLSARQAAVSQQLARLRFEGFVQTRREGKEICYSLKDERVVRMIGLIAEMFCPDENPT